MPIKGTIVTNQPYPTGTIINIYYNSNSLGWKLFKKGDLTENIKWSLRPGEYRVKISCDGYLTKIKDVEIIGENVTEISEPLESNEWVLKEIKSLKMKRKVSFVLAGVIAGTGGYLRNLADKQYNDYQVAGSNAGELRDKVETNDSLAPVFFGAGGVSLSLPLYFHSKIGTLTKMLSE